METTIHIVTKVQSDYDYYNPTVLFATDNLITAEAYALKGNWLLPKLSEYYLDRKNELNRYLNWEELGEEGMEYYDNMYEIYNLKYEHFKRTEFRVDTIPFHLFNKNRYEKN